MDLPPSFARDYPNRSVRLIEGFGAGGGPDLIARVLAPRLSVLWGHRVIVENHPGAGSTTAPALVATSPPDGHTLLVNTSAHAYSVAVSTRRTYDPLRDFIPIAPITVQPYVFVVGKQSGITTLHELIAAAKTQPGTVTFGSMGIGTGSHLGVEKFNREAGVKAMHVPAGQADAISDSIAKTVAGRTTFAMWPIPTALPQIRDGGLLALAVSSSLRSRLLPDVPTVAEEGVTGYDFPIWYGGPQPQPGPWSSCGQGARSQ